MAGVTAARVAFRRMLAAAQRIIALANVFETNYPTIRAEYVRRLTESSLSYLAGNRKDVTLHSALRAVATAYLQAGNAGFRANAPSGEEMDPADAEFIANETDAEMGFVEGLWDDLAKERVQVPLAEISAPHARIEMFARSLDAVYNEMTMRGQKYVSGTWRLGATEHHCATCEELDGQRHQLRWFLNRDYIPRKPGAAMDCGGYHCDCSMVDDDGNEILVEA